MRKQSIWCSSAARRTGFTLLELLIVVAIMLLLAVMTAYAINLSTNTDKVRAAARQVQSFIGGARDRAIYAKNPIGVRLHLDPTNNRTVTSMSYIKATDPWTQGLIQLERLDANNDGIADVSGSQPIVVRGFDNDPNNPQAVPTGWVALWQQGLLYNGAVITVNPGATQYTVDTSLLQFATSLGVTPYYPPRLKLTTNYVDAANNIIASAVPAFMTGGPGSYSLTLPPGLLPGSDTAVLPKNTCIHLDRSSSVRGTPQAPPWTTYVNNLEQQVAGTPASSRGDKLPESWKNRTGGSTDPSGFDYLQTLDILFSPHGTVTGSAASRGLIQLYICEQKDADMDRSYWANPTSYPTSSPPEYGAWADSFAQGWVRGDKVIMTLFTRTGAVGSSNVAPNAGTYQDPFKYAETGQVAGK